MNNVSTAKAISMKVDEYAVKDEKEISTSNEEYKFKEGSGKELSDFKNLSKNQKTSTFAESLKKFQYPLESPRFKHEESVDVDRLGADFPNDEKNELLDSTLQVKRKRGQSALELELEKGSSIKRTTRKTTNRIQKGSLPENLPGVPDHILENPYAILVGLNPGLTSSLRGHAYASPSNSFWKMLNKSGILEEGAEFTYENDQDLPVHGLGITNICARPSASGADLSKEEFREGAFILEEKVHRFRPKVGLFISGKGIWEEMYKATTGNKRLPKDFRFGWQNETFGGARVFVAISSSGRAAGYSNAQKQELWNLFAKEVNLAREFDRRNQ
ncbi:uracil DNA N-glycosylase Thp1 [Schizosaccharomyces cryophilus OY26]|uniref:Uracil DNA N-glycosylase Thp1 n=1 Tax=Schizosaccharomyces cryophilus (strain OY26 / ATCC MYA-4695 / CBS 11777 / NBRC 106824 / NRRL Y48691) TaxID=653667 RepID=S9VY98_SCHCR|nr:uracil DNA N-glycosylase Thp1 [Schizosaccharomyces cryophilus OY26]EPY52633.1 uracil DNA N-glycosylase Thp1 [Schizosaccharomyces cryophilus OY26]